MPRLNELSSEKNHVQFTVNPHDEITYIVSSAFSPGEKAPAHSWVRGPPGFRPGFPIGTLRPAQKVAPRLQCLPAEFPLFPVGRILIVIGKSKETIMAGRAPRGF